jgi:hypothetical protein
MVAGSFPGRSAFRASRSALISARSSGLSALAYSSRLFSVV